MDGELQQIQLIDGEGHYNLTGIEGFGRKVKLAECGLSYAVVAIMGPQSSGKSTLLNHLFGTRFVEMDALRGRSQTTKGVWLARAPNVEPTTLVMDLEGTDGRERGEDDTTFEKQSSLFALAVADVLLINMWCHDIGREHAANKPLLKIVFQMMMRLFTPRKTKLLFIIRDKTKTPLETLEPILQEDIHKIWDSLPKPNQQKEVHFEDFFQIEVVALPNYEEKEEQFKEQVLELRERFQNSIAPGGIAGDRRGVVPGTALALSMQEMWKVIKDNKDLDLPAHKIMVATVRCEEIAAEKVAELKSNQQWLELERKAKMGPVSGFGKQAGDLLKSVLAGYDAEAAFFDESVRGEKRKGLFTSALGVVQEAFTALLGHRRAEALEKFKLELAASGHPSTSAADGASSKNVSTEGFAEAHRRCTESALKAFDKAAADALVSGAGWDYLRTRQKLQRDIDAHALVVRTERLAALQTKAKETLQGKLAEPASSLLDAASPETWPALRALLARETAHAKQELSKAVEGFEMDPEERTAMEEALADAGRESVEKRAKEESAQALVRMKERFNTLFGRDSESMPRTWAGKEDIRAITRESRIGALKLLSVLAAIRLDDDGPDTVAEALETLLEGQEGSMAMHGQADGSSTSGEREATSRNALAGATWENIPSEKTLLTPSACRSLWRQFKAETEYTISSAIAAQEAHKRNNSWLPPPWAIVAMIVLGFNEFMALVRNPLLLCVVVAAYYIGRALWVQLDASAEFENGLVPGLLSISAKFVPTLLRLMKRLYEDGQHRVQHATGIQMQEFASSNSATKWEQNGHQDDASSRATSAKSSKPLRHRGSAAQSGGTGELHVVQPATG